MSARILVVDDEDIVIRSALRVLASEDYALDQARDGAEALRSIEGGNYDVVILDIMMPKVDGIEVLQRVKESHPDIEVIMFTGLAEIDKAVRCMKLGAFDYIAKPFEPDELKTAVARALERRRLLQENRDVNGAVRSEEHTSELQSHLNLVCRLLLEKKKK